jgi:hypothetical protein
MWPSEIKTVYVLCHPEKEKARYERLIPHLHRVGIPPEVIQVCAPTWGSELSVDQIFEVYDPFLKRGDLPAFTFKSACLSRSEISLGLNFAHAIHHAARAATGPIITLESDVYLRDDFVPRLRDLLADLSDSAPDWDFVSLGEGVGTRPPEAPPSYYAPTRAWKPPHQWVFRCTDSMLFSPSYVQRLAKSYPPFKEIIDWEMNFQLMVNRGKALWADPPIVEQGTWYQRMFSSLST